MKQRFYRLLFGTLIPILFLVWFFGVRFKRLPEWAEGIYPFVFWPLLVIVGVLLVVYLIDMALRRM